MVRVIGYFVSVKDAHLLPEGIGKAITLDGVVKKKPPKVNYEDKIEQFFKDADINKYRQINQNAEFELKKARTWLLTNQNRKKSNLDRFVTNWMLRAKPTIQPQPTFIKSL